MIITYLRSSSYGSWDFCQQSYMLTYGLGIKQPSSKKMTIGSIVHKSLEMLARKKLAMQEERSSFKEEEINIDIDTESLTVDEAVELAFAFYKDKEAHIDWRPADLKECHRWTNDTLTMSNGVFNPLTKNIVAPELYFDIEFPQEWAHYAYTLPDGRLLEGQLSIKGTSDLLVKVDENTLECQDYKTGRRVDWSNGDIKTWKKLMKDPQLLIYYYAISYLFPQYKYLIMSIIFMKEMKLDKDTQNRASFSLPYDRDIHFEVAEKMIRKRFEEIKLSNRPKLSRSWRCKSFCFFGKNNWKDTNTTICEHIYNETRALGLTGVMKKYADFSKITSYGSGGGVENRDARENGETTDSTTTK